MSSYEKPKGGRHIEITRKYKASFTNKGKICNKCNVDLELNHYKLKAVYVNNANTLHIKRNTRNKHINYGNKIGEGQI